MSENGVSDVAEVGISNGHAPNGIVNGGGDEGDARGFGSGTGPYQGFHLTKTAEADAFYSMNYPRRGKALIFNQMYFDSKLNLGQRHGTNADRDRLQTLFESLEFEVKVHNDLMYKDLARIVEDAADEDHSNSSCFVLCFLSHGEQGVLFAKDRQFKPDILWEKFSAQHCPSLAGKPKMFFIQACQGDRLDEGVHLVHRKEETDAPAPLYKIPAYADFLIAYSTVPGFFSWRNTTNGSWFIQALSYVLQIRDPAKEDLMSLITEASRVVATQFESNCPGQPHMHAKKQVPFITMTLTRKILLTPLKSSSGEREPRKNSEPEATDDVQQKPKKRKKSSWNPLKTCSCI